jgi:hypothetical protein
VKSGKTHNIKQRGKITATITSPSANALKMAIHYSDQHGGFNQLQVDSKREVFFYVKREVVLQL